MFCDFQTRTYGKWILTGEHSVIRGGGALVFPIKAKQLHLDYRAGNAELTLSSDGMYGADFVSLFHPVMEQALRSLGRSPDSLQGSFHWNANLPIGQGMGASAAFCVAITRWLIAQNWLDAKAHFSFARELEHGFHGKSSGLDIAGVSADGGMYFEKGEARPINLTWQPQWYLSSCNQTGLTAECVKKVEALHEKNPALAERLDEQMQASVLLARSALETESEGRKDKLILAINKAADCFQCWNLVNPELQRHMQYLTAQGALAVKPTGSGGGGYVVSLWDKVPPAELELIAIQDFPALVIRN